MNLLLDGDLLELVALLISGLECGHLVLDLGVRRKLGLTCLLNKLLLGGADHVSSGLAISYIGYGPSGEHLVLLYSSQNLSLALEVRGQLSRVQTVLLGLFLVSVHVDRALL